MFLLLYCEFAKSPNCVCVRKARKTFSLEVHVSENFFLPNKQFVCVLLLPLLQKAIYIFGSMLNWGSILIMGCVCCCLFLPLFDSLSHFPFEMILIKTHSVVYIVSSFSLWDLTWGGGWFFFVESFLKQKVVNRMCRSARVWLICLNLIFQQSYWKIFVGETWWRLWSVLNT